MPLCGGCGSVWLNAGFPSLATNPHQRHRPHVSRTVAKSLAVAESARLRVVPATRRPALHLHILATFPGTEAVVLLGATASAELLAFHSDVHAALAWEPVEHWPYYLPGTWVPHCTLAEGLDEAQVAKAFTGLLGYEPITATVTSVGIKDTRTGEIRLLTEATGA